MTRLPTGSAETASGVRPCGTPLINTSAPEGSESTSSVPTSAGETVRCGESDVWAAGAFPGAAETGPSSAAESGPTEGAPATFRSASGLASATVATSGSAAERGDWPSRDVRRGRGATNASTTSSTRVAAPAVIRRTVRGRGRWNSVWSRRYAAGRPDAGRVAALTRKARSVARW